MPAYFSDKTRSAELPTYFNYLPIANPPGALRGLQYLPRTDSKVSGLPEHASWLDDSLLPMITQKLGLVMEERTGGRDSCVYRAPRFAQGKKLKAFLLMLQIYLVRKQNG